MSPLENGRNRKRFAGLRRHLRETSARTCMKTRRRCSSNSMDANSGNETCIREGQKQKNQQSCLIKFPNVGRQVSPGRSFEFCGAKRDSLKQASARDGLDICAEDCGSGDLIKGSLRIKAIRKAFVEVVQLFHPPPPPTTLEHHSLHTPTSITSTHEGGVHSKASGFVI